MAKNNSKTLAATVGAAFLATATLSPLVSAAENPFQVSELSSGYKVADAHEGKCGDSKAEGEGKCGDAKAEGEGKCGDSKAEGEGKCGESKSDEEGKCGEGKCGAE